MRCDYCEKQLKIGDDYIHVLSEDVRYCGSCYESSTTTTYSVGGEYVGDNDYVEEYYEFREEGDDEH